MKVDGRQTFFEWLDAGHYEAGNQRGTMTLVSAGVIQDLYFGFDTERLLLRIDTAGSARMALPEDASLRIDFLSPEATQVTVDRLHHAGGPRARLNKNGTPVKGADVTAAVDEIIELAMRFSDLGVQPGDALHWCVEILDGGHSLDRAPSEGTIETRTPNADFERIHWQV